MATKNKDLSDIPVVILAGGLGTRLKTVLPDRPKTLALVGGRPFLSYLLDQIERAGFKKVILCTGHLGESIKKTFGKSYGNLSLVYSQEPKPLGTGGAVRWALPLIRDNLVFVMNGDSYTDIDFCLFLNAHLNMGFMGSIALKWEKNPRRYGTAVVAENSIIKNFKEKSSRTGPGWINVGIYIFSRRLLKSFPRGKNLSLENEVIPLLLKRKISGFFTQSKFIDIGTPASLKKAAKFFEKI